MRRTRVVMQIMVQRVGGGNDQQAEETEQEQGRRQPLQQRHSGGRLFLAWYHLVKTKHAFCHRNKPGMCKSVARPQLTLVLLFGFWSGTGIGCFK